MGSVTNIETVMPHIKRKVRCVECNHRWWAVYLAKCGDDIDLECPKCLVIVPQIMSSAIDIGRLKEFDHE